MIENRLVKLTRIVAESNDLTYEELYSEWIKLPNLPRLRGEVLGAEQYFKDHPEKLGVGESICSDYHCLTLLALRIEMYDAVEYESAVIE
jgi:hypothetical protein